MIENSTRYSVPAPSKGISRSTSNVRPVNRKQLGDSVVPAQESWSQSCIILVHYILSGVFKLQGLALNKALVGICSIHWQG